MMQDGETVVAFVSIEGQERRFRNIWNDRDGIVLLDEITIGDHRPRGIYHFNNPGVMNFPDDLNMFEMHSPLSLSSRA